MACRPLSWPMWQVMPGARQGSPRVVSRQQLSWSCGRPWGWRGAGLGPSQVGCSKGLLLKALWCSCRPHPASDAPTPALEAIAYCLTAGQGQVTWVRAPGRATEDDQADKNQAAAPEQAPREEPGPCQLSPQPCLLGRSRLLHPRCGAAGEQQQPLHAAPH